MPRDTQLTFDPDLRGPLAPVPPRLDGDDAPTAVHDRQRIVPALGRALPIELDPQCLGTGYLDVARERRVVDVGMRRLLDDLLGRLARAVRVGSGVLELGDAELEQHRADRLVRLTEGYEDRGYRVLGTVADTTGHCELQQVDQHARVLLRQL